MKTLVERGYVVKCFDVRGLSFPVRPRLIQGLSAEETKPRLIYDAQSLNQRCKRIRFTMDTVARVANVACEGCAQGSLDYSSAFRQILLNPASWPLIGLEYLGVDYVRVLGNAVRVPYLE